MGQSSSVEGRADMSPNEHGRPGSQMSCKLRVRTIMKNACQRADAFESSAVGESIVMVIRA